MNDPVKNPAHYTSGNIEVWDFIADQGLNFDLGNAIKYICRAGKKDKSKYVEDLEKAKAYIDHELEVYNDKTVIIDFDGTMFRVGDVVRFTDGSYTDRHCVVIRVDHLYDCAWYGVYVSGNDNITVTSGHNLELA